MSSAMNGSVNHAAPPMALSDARPGVREFFEGRSVFVTGAGGFMGKVLVEKLLRTCHGIKALYVLLRPKRNKDLKQRTDALLQVKLFDRLKKEHPEALAKLVIINGDIQKDDLGLAEEDEELLTKEVSVVFHLAATVRFDDNFRETVDINVLGTRRVMDLCTKMRHISAVIHISTAFCFCDRPEIGEVVYPLPHGTKNVLDALQWMDDDLIESIAPKLIGNRPNTYLYTKALAERLVVENYGHLPLAIVRPSVVIASLSDPFPGWIETINGPTGFVIGYGKGLIRCVHIHKEKSVDYIPVDSSINLIIATAWYTANSKSNMLVYNCVSGNQLKMTQGEMQSNIVKELSKNPFSGVMWYPSTTLWRSKVWFNVHVVLSQIFPLLFLDIIAMLCGQRPFFRILRGVRKFHKVFDNIEYFATHEWKFITDNVTMVWEALSLEDRKKYAEDYVAGVRQHILKECPSTLPAARRHLNIMYLIYLLFHILAFVVIWQLLVVRWVPVHHIQDLTHWPIYMITGLSHV